MRQVLTILSLGVLCSLTSVCLATEPESQSKRPKLFLDLNKDGFISYEEFSHSVAEGVVNKWDANDNAKLSEAEIEARNKALFKKHDPEITVQVPDTDKDDRLSPAELERATKQHPEARALFDELDTNHNDKLNPDELSEFPGLEFFRFKF